MKTQRRGRGSAAILARFSHKQSILFWISLVACWILVSLLLVNIHLSYIVEGAIFLVMEIITLYFLYPHRVFKNKKICGQLLFISSFPFLFLLSALISDVPNKDNIELVIFTCAFIFILFGWLAFLYFRLAITEKGSFPNYLKGFATGFLHIVTKKQVDNYRYHFLYSHSFFYVGYDAALGWR